ncbi:NAD(P)-dependent oxidoreductase [Thiomonas sp. FB-6]|uniref:NAD(P)-dependent oxidoreductase n=1 Tax=Thiomonas sp. FB-6 TaxID=1158291 RepID=UPI0003712104|nr:NAD(P)-dependent oxidoreductase [Thiomonas sp. FB-6]
MQDSPQSPQGAGASLRIGFIGLGAMGWPMALRLREAGHELAAWARGAETARRAGQAGIALAGSPAELAAGAQVLVSNVTSTEDVEQVLLGAQGAVHGARPGLLCIDHSTIAPQGARRIAAQLASRAVGFVDAPVSGGERGAREGTLSIMAGGTPPDFERALPLLRLHGPTVTYIGPPGSGQVAKLCNQLVQVVNIQGIAEAMRLAAAEGAPLERVLQALGAGFAGSRMLDLMGPKMAARDFAAGIQARLHEKDFGLLEQAADDAGLELPALRLVHAQLRALVRAGWGRDDTSSLLRVLESGEAPHGASD